MRPVSFLPAVAVLSFTVAAPLVGQQATSGEQAYVAWDEGDYVTALEGFISALSSSAPEAEHERIALLTGELYETTEIAPDGSAIGFSPDGRFLSYETGSDAGVVTHIVRVADGGGVAELPGHSVTFSPTGQRVAYLAPGDSPELRQARSALDAIVPGDRQAYLAQRTEVARLEASAASLVVHDLGSGQERRLDDEGLIKAELTFAADGQAVYVLGAQLDDRAATDLYAISPGVASPRRVTSGPGIKLEPLITSDGRYLIYHLSEPSASRSTRSTTGQVVVQDLSTGETREYDGDAPALSADGSTLAFRAADGDETLIQVIRLDDDGAPITVARTDEPVGGTLAVAPDGRRVAYQRMPAVSWEIYVARADGSGDARLSDEIQHDQFPTFLTADRLMALQGEGRHRRSYLYDVNTGERQRLHHNNTVRTIAPEYEWAVSPDGSKVLIVADRDGDTISPERGVYLMDLERKVTRSALLERLRTGLGVERELRERGQEMFAPIQDEVRRATEQVSSDRLYEYQTALYDFGSKHITMPGNRPAGEYLHELHRSFGLEPEYQWFEPQPGLRTANVVVAVPGTEHPELIYVLSSHYDSVDRSPGADDNTSGTAVLLETARILAQNPLPATVVFASLTGEESGLLGAGEFVRRALENGDRIVGIVNNDMLGWTRHHRLDNTIRYSNDGIRDVQHAAAFLFSDLITYDAHYYRGTDAAAFYRAYGDIVGGFGSYPVLGNPNYHQATDRLETVNQSLVTETARANIATLMLLASSPSRLAGLEQIRFSGGSAEIGWVGSPERDVRRYEVAYGPPEDPLRQAIVVNEPRAVLSGVSPGTVVSVRAVNERGLHGWDWARLVVE